MQWHDFCTNPFVNFSPIEKVIMNGKENAFAPCLYLALLALLFSAYHQPANAGIIQVSYESLTGEGREGFDSFELRGLEQIHFDEILKVGIMSFGKHFEGQTISYGGWNNYNDILNGSASGPLTLVSGGEGQNVQLWGGGAGTLTEHIMGTGRIGFDSLYSAGEGAISIFFDYDQSHLGFSVIGGTGSYGVIQFWSRDGSLIEELSIHLYGDGNFRQFFGFTADDGERQIAGVSIYNIDYGGIALDNFVFDNLGPQDNFEKPASIPSPNTIGLLVLGLCGLYSRRYCDTRAGYKTLT